MEEGGREEGGREREEERREIRMREGEGAKEGARINLQQTEQMPLSSELLT